MIFISFCGSLYPFIKVVKVVLSLLQIAVPIALLVFGAIDFGRAVIASKEDEMKKAQSIFIKRVLYAVVIFLVFTIVSFVMRLVADSAPMDQLGNPLDVDSWRACWKCDSKAECEAIGSYSSDDDENAACYYYVVNGSSGYAWGDHSSDKGYYLQEGITNKYDCLLQK